MQQSLQTKEEQANFFAEESSLVTESSKIKTSYTSFDVPQFEDSNDSFTALEETEPVKKMDKITSDTDSI